MHDDRIACWAKTTPDAVAVADVAITCRTFDLAINKVAAGGGPP